MYIMCVCLFRALSRRIGALQISIIIIIACIAQRTTPAGRNEEQLKPAVRIQFQENLDDGDVNFYRIPPSGTEGTEHHSQSLSASC